MKHLAQARKVFDIELAALKAVRAQLDASFDGAVETIADALAQRGKIVVVGIGKSGNVGQKIAATLTSTGSTSVVLNSVDALHGDLGIVERRRRGSGVELFRRVGRIAQPAAGAQTIFRQNHFLHRQFEIVAGPTQRHGAQRQSSEGSLSVQPRADGEHDRDAGDGRRAGDGGVAGARLQAKRLRQAVIPPARLAARCC